MGAHELVQRTSSMTWVCRLVQEEIDLLLIRAGLSSDDVSPAEGIDFEAFLEAPCPLPPWL